MESNPSSWLPTAAWLGAILSVYLGFILSGKLARAEKPLLAISVPVWVFAPTMTLLQSWGGGVSKTDVLAILGFAAVLVLVTWGYVRKADGS